MHIGATCGIMAEPATPSVQAIPVAPPASDPTVAEPTTSTTEPATPTGATPPPSKFLQKLASGHFNPVADLRHRMRLADEIKDSGLTLPELRAPQGHGKAYQKFLAAYRAMSAPAPAPIDPSPTDPAGEPIASGEPASTPVAAVPVTPINVEG